jgi:hypothetical protein
LTTRRNFLGLIGASTVLPVLPAPFPSNDELRPIATDWDLSWIDRIQKPHKVVFDSPAVSEGGAIYRSVMLRDQYREVFGTFPDQIGSVLVIRHAGIPLAMDHAYWETYGGGEQAEMKDRDGNWLTRNPMGAPAADARPNAAKYTIPGFIAAGGIVLCCDLALRGFIVPNLTKAGIARDVARDEAVKMLIPGVIVQPSGFFAVLRAQQAGCAVFCNGE